MFGKISLKMDLTERECEILELSKQGLSDYKIARKISTDPPSITRSRKNAHKKIENALTTLEWISKREIVIEPCSVNTVSAFRFFL